MKINLFGFNASVSKRSPSFSSNLSLSDVREVNDVAVDYLKGLTRKEIDDRLSLVSVSSLNDLDYVKKILDEYGIIIVPHYVPYEDLLEIMSTMEKIKEFIESFIDSGESFSENDRVLLQNGEAKLSGYRQLSSYEKSVVQVRKGQDDGMIDIFNVDKWFEEVGHVLRPFFDSAQISDILQLDGKKSGAENLNFYINESITKTRGFHVDSYGKQLKGFVYLTDVSSLDDGPYTYVKGSHVDSAFRRINKQISSVLPNKTESPVVPLRDVIPVLAPKGALVISDQGGVHRGFPQTEGHKRAIAVMNYT